MIRLKRGLEKRGVSPVIATTLLITLTIILAVIVFIWARSFIGEAVEKNGEKAENFCPDVSFEATARFGNEGLEIGLINRGNVPIYGIEVRQKGISSVKNVGSLTRTISSGQVGTLKEAEFSGDLSNIKLNDELIIIPIILGETDDSRISFPCDEEYGETITVQ